jgi:hypothetical protein
MQAILSLFARKGSSGSASTILETPPANAAQRSNFPPQTNPKVNEMSASASTIFSQLAALAGEDVFTNVIPVINSALADIEANPATWTNPATAIIKGNAFLANMVATLPTIEASAVTGAAQLVGAIITGLNAKLAATAASVTPATIASEIGGTAAAPTPAPVAGSIAAS